MRSIFLATTLACTLQATAANETAQGNNHFAFDLFQKLPKDKNVFFSPYSISAALAMTYAGAKTSTATEMEKVLHIDDAATFHDRFGKLMESINGLNGKDLKMSVANRLFGAQKFEFLDAYLKKVSETYKASLLRLDFANKAEESRKEINAWVEKQTRNKIKNLLPQGVINAATSLILVNAIYFYGDWDSQFKEEATQSGKFYTDAEKTMDAKLMYQQSHYEYAETGDFKALRVPYKGRRVSMEIYLPKEKNGLPAFEKTLTAKAYQDWSKQFKSYKVQFTLPKFNMTSSFSLSTVLKQLGMKTAFASTADFSGMTGKRNLFVSEVVHKAFIDVGEKGTEAAAATAVIMEVTSARMEPDLEEIKIFKADHPFFFVIRENSSGCILFMGHVLSPQKA